jgi:hypothetical protein
MGEGKMAEMRALAEADAGAVDLPVIPGLGDDIAACRGEQLRGEVSLAAEARGMSPAQWFAAALRGPVHTVQGEPVVRRSESEGSAVARGAAMHEDVERRSGGGEPEVYPPTGYTGLTAAQVAGLRDVWEGAHLRRNGGEGFAESEDGHVFKLSDAANAHMRRVGAVYTACQWTPGKALPPGGPPRDWTPGARFRLNPTPLGETGDDVGVTLICVVAGADVHRAQVVFRVDGAAAPRSLLIGLWKLATRPEGA